MKYDEVATRLAELDYEAWTSAEAGELLYYFVLETEVEDVLELGFAHGTSTAYMAAALAERGVGCVTTIDRAAALSHEPNIHRLMDQLGLQGYVRPLVRASTYNWELMRTLEKQTTGGETTPCFDFCFVDGAHTWETDGFAFLLATTLLRPDRWMLFDDLNWTIAKSPSTSPEKFQALSDDELATQQVRKVFDLLVRRHPAYATFAVTGNYGWAYKRADAGEGLHQGDVADVVGPRLLGGLRGARKSSDRGTPPT